MADKPAAERTEQPTAKRLSKAKSKGQTPQSQEMLSFISIVILITMITFLAPQLMQWFTLVLKEGLSCNTTIFANNSTFINFTALSIYFVWDINIDTIFIWYKF